MRVRCSTFLSITRIDCPRAFSIDRQFQISSPDQRREAFGRFIQDQQFRVGHQRAADREHLLLAAGELVAHVAAALGEPRKQRMDFLQRPGIGRIEAVGGGGDEIFAHGEVRENLPALGHEADAELGDAVGRQLAHLGAAQSGSRRRGRGVSPMMERMVVVLPMPLRPISETISPALIDSDRPNSTWLSP